MKKKRETDYILAWATWSARCHLPRQGCQTSITLGVFICFCFQWGERHRWFKFNRWISIACEYAGREPQQGIRHMYLKFIKKKSFNYKYLEKNYAKVIVKIIWLMKLPGERWGVGWDGEDSKGWVKLCEIQRFKMSLKVETSSESPPMFQPNSGLSPKDFPSVTGLVSETEIHQSVSHLEI